jgi:hypothetical protein
MKLIVEKHPEFERLARYFQKIESMADHMGVRVDDLVRRAPLKGNLIQPTFNTEQKEIAEHRKEILTHHLTIVK